MQQSLEDLIAEAKAEEALNLKPHTKPTIEQIPPFMEDTVTIPLYRFENLLHDQIELSLLKRLIRNCTEIEKTEIDGDVVDTLTISPAFISGVANISPDFFKALR